MYSTILIRLLREVMAGYKNQNIGLFLSGGLDSAILQILGDFNRLYCCTWDDENNLYKAEIAAQGKIIREVTFNKLQMFEIIPQIARLTNGTGNWSNVCQWFLAQYAKRDGCDLILTGEGADELFGGYSRYRILYWYDRARYDKNLIDYQAILRSLMGSPSDMLDRWATQRNIKFEFDVNKANELESLVKYVMRHDTDKNLPQLLKNETAMVRSHGLKIEYPYLHDRIRNFAEVLPVEQLITDRDSKHVLREAARRLGVSYRITEETTKKGLYIPQSWRPAGEPQWRTHWFDELMRKAWEKSGG